MSGGVLDPETASGELVAGVAQAIFVARKLSDGSLIGAGSIELGLGVEPIGQLEQSLAELPQRR